jgi:hemerythrin-like domain-containing protein
MLDIMFYMTHYPDVLHHPKEDLAFARLAERSDRALSIVAELAEQHAQLKRNGNALVVALDDIVNGSISSRDHIEAPGRAYIAEFRGHMDVEEAKILPLAATLLDRDDWAAIDSAVRSLEDPVFGKTANERYAALRRHITRGGRTGRPAAAPDQRRESASRNAVRVTPSVALCAIPCGNRCMSLRRRELLVHRRTKSFCLATTSLVDIVAIAAIL